MEKQALGRIPGETQIVGSWRVVLTMLRLTWCSQSVPHMAEAGLQQVVWPRGLLSSANKRNIPLRSIKKNCHLKLTTRDTKKYTHFSDLVSSKETSESSCK